MLNKVANDVSSLDALSASPAAQVTADHAKTYTKDGFVLVKGMLSGSGLEALQSDTERLFDAPLQEEVFTDAPAIWCWRHRPDGKRSVFKADSSPVIHNMIYGGDWHQEIMALVGTEYLQMYECVVFDKPAGVGEAFFWHNDRSYYPINPGRSVSMWMAIDECDEETGALRFARGSHRHDDVPPVNVKTGEAFDSDADAAMLDDPESVGYETTMVHMMPGDAVFFDANTWHASPPNISANRRRRGVVVRFWLEPNIYEPAPGKTATFVRQVTCAPGEVISGPCFPVFEK